ncbi:exodeoxyribonuclease V subunit alpha [Candidatus Halobeggiatoa sp. HSG11]|nr:exodeoxyribonuclease V subunit alpha [Candidatus Halobeggiatoa sp. HSG11]
MLSAIKKLYKEGIFSDLDIHFAKLMAELSDNSDEILLGGALVSYYNNQGSSCVNLHLLAGKPFPPESDTSTILCPQLLHWETSLINCNVVGSPGDCTPLILNNHRLYSYRYFNYEFTLAARIHSLININDINYQILSKGLERLFSKQPSKQKEAAYLAVSHNFCIISGGPGTGKTATVIKILALLLEQSSNLNLVMVAPTGKAANRLKEAITKKLPSLDCDSTIKAAIPTEAYTIHRLLGSKLNSPYFHFSANNPLPYDVIVVDEASMIDLALMTKLMQAVPDNARLILLGDKDQLASVEAGTVLGDICAASLIQSSVIDNSQLTVSNSKLNDINSSIILLDKSYRFSEQSGIWKLAQAVKQGDGETALQVLKSTEYPDVEWHSTESSSDLIKYISTNFSILESEPEIALQQFDKFRVLCATRHGSYGILNINQSIENYYRQSGQIKAHRYHGQPIIIKRNDYHLNLFNGDIGIIFNIAGQQKAIFQDATGQLREFWPNRLPEYETVYAMTIHKSQGSEFEKVLMILPEHFSPVLTRQLIYTGITRAGKTISIWGNEQIFTQAITTEVNRSSGLTELCVM